MTGLWVVENEKSGVVDAVGPLGPLTVGGGGGVSTATEDVAKSSLGEVIA